MGSSRINAKNPLHDPAYIRFAEQLRVLREKAGLSQRDLARRLGTPLSYVGKCERRDRRVDPIELIRWCEGCEVDAIKTLRAIYKFTAKA